MQSIRLGRPPTSYCWRQASVGATPRFPCDSQPSRALFGRASDRKVSCLGCLARLVHQHQELGARHEVFWVSASLPARRSMLPGSEKKLHGARHEGELPRTVVRHRPTPGCGASSQPDSPPGGGRRLESSAFRPTVLMIRGAAIRDVAALARRGNPCETWQPFVCSYPCFTKFRGAACVPTHVYRCLVVQLFETWQPV